MAAPSAAANPELPRDIAWAADCSEDEVPILGRQRAIDALLKASRDYRADYATLAHILQSRPDQPD
jgi:hypothetical protein